MSVPPKHQTPPTREENSLTTLTERLKYRIALAFIFTVGLLLPLGGLIAATWNTGGTTSFEEIPQDSENVSLGASRIRATKNEVRLRADVEHDWATATAGNTDSGRLRSGAGRAFYQATAPTELSGPVDTSSSPNKNLDTGRLWVDSDDKTLWANTAAAGASFARVSAMPQYAIILWDQANGDVNCDGTPNAGECPCGYTEATEFRNLALRGADVAAGYSGIPDAPGTTCDNSYGGTLGTGCGGAVDQYQDVQTSTTLAGHQHTYNAPSGATDAGGGSGYGSTTLISTGSTGSSNAWYHPFRTVLFCRKT